MKKLSPWFFILILILLALTSFFFVPQVKEFVSSRLGFGEVTPSPNPRLGDYGDSGEPTEEEVLYGEVYLDDQKVSIQGNKFNPDNLTVKAGTTVIWINADSIKHSVVIENGASTPPLAKGASGSITFGKTGTFVYYDGLNKDIKGVVIVE